MTTLTFKEQHTSSPDIYEDAPETGEQLYVSSVLAFTKTSDTINVDHCALVFAAATQIEAEAQAQLRGRQRYPDAEHISTAVSRLAIAPAW